MSSGGHDEHVPGSQEPSELSHPVLWTIGLLVAIAGLAYLFFHLKQVGKDHVRGEPVWKIATAGPGEPDHAKLIADKSQAVIDRGQQLYQQNCLSCHGPKGDSNPANMSPHPRYFTSEAFKNKLGSGPYAFFRVLTEGYGSGMPAFKALTPEDRYAVVHYVAETMMKPANPAYLAVDAPEVRKQIPAAGSGGGAAAAANIDPRRVEPPAPTRPLMAAVAKEETQREATIARWLDESLRGADARLQPAFARLRQIAGSAPARLQRLRSAAAAQDRAAFIAVLTAEDGAGSADPVFSLMSRDTVGALYARLAETASRMAP